ncbi:MAG TPA: PKD domain-containing protein, partial [Planctomycetes bacterium]|nr:PKD domain-containing protein [Planctomycetota bacterium]
IDVLFSGGGTYVVAVLVSDDKGAKTFQSVPVNIAGNQAPTASFTRAPSSGAPPLIVNVDASASSDPDGFIVSYEWDFHYDGVTFNVEDTGVTTSYQYDNEGTFTIALRVTDDGSAWRIATNTVIVSSGPINNPPVIDSLTANPPSSGTWPVENVEFTVVYHDDDGDTCLIEWDTAYNWGTFNPNPAYEDDNPLVMTFNAPGIYDIAVRVSDGNGGVAIRAYRFTVGLCRADFYITNAAEELVYNAPGAPIQMDVARRATWPDEWPWFTQPNHPIVYVATINDTLYFHDATTPAGIATEWVWEFGDGNASIAQNPNHQYTTPGIYEVVLSVNLSGSNWSTSSSVVAVYDPALNQGVVVHAINEQTIPGDAANYIRSDLPDSPPVSTVSLRCYAQSAYGNCPVIRTDVANATYYPIPGGATILEAGLAMSVCRENSVGDDDYVRVYAVTVGWEEATVTWNQIINSPWARPLASAVGADLSTIYSEIQPRNFAPDNAQEPYKSLYIELTTLVQGWLSGSITNYGCLITLNNDNRERSGALNFMNAQRTSDYTSQYLEPCMVILYQQ